MPDADEPEQPRPDAGGPGSFIQKYWALLAEIALVLAGVVGGILTLPPSAVSDGGDGTLANFSRFVAAVIAGLAIILGRVYGGRRFVRWWWTTALVTLVLAIAVFFVYQSRYVRATCNYYGKRILIGSEYTEWGARYVQAHPNYDCERILSEITAPRRSQLWTEESIRSNGASLALLHTAGFVIIVLCMVSVTQALDSTFGGEPGAP